MISDQEIRQILIESLYLENNNSECKVMIKHLNAKSPPTDEWM